MTYPRESTTGQHLVKQIKAAGGIAYKFVSPGRRPVPHRLILLPGGRILAKRRVKHRHPRNSGNMNASGRWDLT